MRVEVDLARAEAVAPRGPILLEVRPSSGFPIAVSRKTAVGQGGRAESSLAGRVDRYGWIFTGPTTLFPTACTDPVPGGGSVPVLPVIVTGPVTLL